MHIDEWVVNLIPRVAALEKQLQEKEEKEKEKQKGLVLAVKH
jgi:hypothetical protein